MSFKRFFHLSSYLQYPFMFAALYFVIRPYFNGFEYFVNNPDIFFRDVNSMLILMGLGISFSSLQDVTKSQNSISKKIWSDPKKGKFFIYLIIFLIISFLTVGLLGYFLTGESIVKEVSVGCIVLSLGMFGFLKAAVEMSESHRLDRSQI